MKKEVRKKSGKSRRGKSSAGNVKTRAARSKRPKAIVIAPASETTPVVTEPTAIAETIMPPAKPERHTSRRALLTAVAVIFAIMLLWVAANICFSRFQVGTSTVSARFSNAILQRRVTQDATQYHLRIIYPGGGSKAFSLDAMGLLANPTASVAEARHQQRSLKHLLAWWHPITLRLQTTADTKKLDDFIAQNASIVTQPARDAQLSIVDGTAQITAGATGKQYGLRPPPEQTVRAQVATMRTGPLQLSSVALQPKITPAALAVTKTTVQTILQQHITVAVGTENITPSPQDIAQWISLTPKDHGVAPTVNTDKLHDYLNDIASAHNQPPRSQVLLDTTGAVLVNGVRGTSVGDTQEAADTIARTLLDGKGAAASLPVRYTAFKTVRAPVAGKWIEVDTSTKRLYAYDQGELVRTMLVSAGAAATPTVTGRFAIYSKYRAQDMFGGNADGTNYFQPKVPYVNYFYRDYAIHGNYWRPSSYFGNVNSSHGCVGLPVSDGAWVYTWAPIGTPVIVHT